MHKPLSFIKCLLYFLPVTNIIVEINEVDLNAAATLVDHYLKKKVYNKTGRMRL